MSLSFLPAQKGGCVSSVGVCSRGAMCMTESSLTNLEDEVSTFAFMGQWPFLSLTKSADWRQNLKIVSEARSTHSKTVLWRQTVQYTVTHGLSVPKQEEILNDTFKPLVENLLTSF